MNGKLKAAAVVYESAIERDLREQRGRESSELLREVERVRHGGARWDDTRKMLGWYYATEGHMESAPGIDYARDLVQGIQVDRDERIHARAYVDKALLHLERTTGTDRGRVLLWLHFRAPRPIREVRERDGRKRMVYGEPGVAIRALHEQFSGAGRNETIRAFWRAFEVVEDYALNKGLVKYRLERRGEQQKPQVYRRQG